MVIRLVSSAGIKKYVRTEMKPLEKERDSLREGDPRRDLLKGKLLAYDDILWHLDTAAPFYRVDKKDLGEKIKQ